MAYHLSYAPVCHNVAGMYQPIEHLCSLLDQVTLVWIIFQLVVWTERTCILPLALLLTQVHNSGGVGGGGVCPGPTGNLLVMAGILTLVVPAPFVLTPPFVKNPACKLYTQHGCMLDVPIDHCSFQCSLGGPTEALLIPMLTRWHHESCCYWRV